MFRYLATTVVFRDNDMPARTLTGDDEIFARDLAHTELHYLGINGIYLANAIYMIANRFGIPSRADIEDFCGAPAATPR